MSIGGKLVKVETALAGKIAKLFSNFEGTNTKPIQDWIVKYKFIYILSFLITLGGYEGYLIQTAKTVEPVVVEEPTEIGGKLLLQMSTENGVFVSDKLAKADALSAKAKALLDSGLSDEALREWSKIDKGIAEAFARAKRIRVTK